MLRARVEIAHMHSTYLAGLMLTLTGTLRD